MNKVRAKFFLNSKIEIGITEDGEKTFNLDFSPVFPNGTEENSKFWEATPAGGLQLYGVRANVADQFEVFGQYYLDLTFAGLPDVVAVGVDFGETASVTASYMPRNIMTSEDGKTCYGRCDQFVDEIDFRLEALDTIGTVKANEKVSSVETVCMRPATHEELIELNQDEWWFEVQPDDDQNIALKHYKVSIEVVGEV